MPTARLPKDVVGESEVNKFEQVLVVERRGPCDLWIVIPWEHPCEHSHWQTNRQTDHDRLHNLLQTTRVVNISRRENVNGSFVLPGTSSSIRFTVLTA